MRHPPSFQAEVAPGRAWCLAWGLLVALASASLLAWLMAWLNLPAALLLLAPLPGLWAGRQMRHQPPQSLRWDGQAWLLGPATDRGSESRRGRLRPLLDLGAWMLLRFDDGPERRFGLRCSHLALSRVDIPLEWPLLRVTLYSGAVATERPETSPQESSPIR